MSGEQLAIGGLRTETQRRGWHVSDESLAIARDLLEFALIDLDEPVAVSSGPDPPRAITEPMELTARRDLPNSVTAITTAYRTGELTPTECVAECIERTAEAGRILSAVAAVIPPEAAAAACRTAETRLRSGTARPLEGVPFVVKDVLDTAGFPTSFGSLAWAASAPKGKNSAAAATLTRAGAIPIAKAVTTEFAFGSLLNKSFPPVLNPRDRERVTGGSSSGAAALVGCGAVPFALASDAAGSSRSPASYCGAVGYKPTTGVIPMDGVPTASPLLEGGGLLAGCTEDLQTAMQAFGVRAESADTGPGVLGVPVGWQGYANPAVVAATERWLATAADAGWTVRSVPSRIFSLAYRAGWRLLLADAGRGYGRCVLSRRGVDPVLAARIVAGALIPDAAYEQALVRRKALLGAMADVFATGIDVLVSPTVGNLAPSVDSLAISLATEQDRIRASTVFTIIANVLGCPAVSIPVQGPAALPVGVQLIARPGTDALLLGTARRLAASTTPARP